MSKTPPDGFEPITDEGAFVQHIGPLLGKDGIVGLQIDERHINSFGKAQGGVLATLVDFATAHNVRRDKRRRQPVGRHRQPDGGLPRGRR